MSIPNTEITKGAHAKGGTGLYNSINGSKNHFANLFNPINSPKGTPINIPKLIQEILEEKSPKYALLVQEF